MELSRNIIRGIYSVGYEAPSRIQGKAVPVILSGHDLIAQSEAGTGKTAAYVLGLLGRIDDNSKHVQAIVVTPVRELALASSRCIERVAEFTNVKVQKCVGGTAFKEERLQIVRNKPQVIVGTPGRILDHIQKESFSTA